MQGRCLDSLKCPVLGEEKGAGLDRPLAPLGGTACRNQRFECKSFAIKTSFQSPWEQPAMTFILRRCTRETDGVNVAPQPDILRRCSLPLDVRGSRFSPPGPWPSQILENELSLSWGGIHIAVFPHKYFALSLARKHIPASTRSVEISPPFDTTHWTHRKARDLSFVCSNSILDVLAIRSKLR